VIIASPITPLENLLRSILDFFHDSVGLPWAWSIVALTILVRTALLPLTVRQIHSMQALQRHAPEMKSIQQKYKGDRQKMNEELMKFYRENSINPAASCLPLAAQIPVFISLFYVLKNFERTVLPGLSDPGPLGWLGIVPNIADHANSHWSGYMLLAIYALSQTTSTLFMSTTMERTQRILLLALPLVFLFFILNFPAGLVLYWVTTNLWTTGQGLITRRLMPKGPLGAAQPAAKRTSRTPPKAEPARADDGAAKAAASPPAPVVRKVKRKKRARR
jgi:YidC/Oxa1 family membrane protein insertase